MRTHNEALQELSRVNNAIGIIKRYIEDAKRLAEKPGLQELAYQAIDRNVMQLDKYLIRRTELVNELIHKHGLAREWVYLYEDKAAQL